MTNCIAQTHPFNTRKHDSNDVGIEITKEIMKAFIMKLYLKVQIVYPDQSQLISQNNVRFSSRRKTDLGVL